MHFDLSIRIERSPQDVFGFLRDKDKYPQEPGSPVLVLDQTTPGPAGVGTRYLEVVRMLPFVRGEIHSVITDFEPGRRLAEDFEGAGMVGHLEYRFEPEGDGTRLTQRETIQTRGFVRALAPLVKRMLGRQLRKRLEGMKTILESGWVVDEQD
jgi:carbon monoxide dehydrogenase subunit G